MSLKSPIYLLVHMPFCSQVVDVFLVFLLLTGQITMNNIHFANLLFTSSFDFKSVVRYPFFFTVRKPCSKSCRLFRQLQIVVAIRIIITIIILYCSKGPFSNEKRQKSRTFKAILLKKRNTFIILKLIYD